MPVLHVRPHALSIRDVCGYGALAGRRCAIFRLVTQPNLLQVPAVQIFELTLCFASGQVSARPQEGVMRHQLVSAVPVLLCATMSSSIIYTHTHTHTHTHTAYTTSL